MMQIIKADSRNYLTDEQAANRRLVRYWLYFVYFLLILLVFIGGVTRLTGSGLSITEWQPIHGVIPPLNQEEWQEEFTKYQQIAQYKEINPDMTLSGFKFIFWWEWLHRLLARFVFAIAVLLPLLYFWATKRLEKRVKWGLFGIFLLGGFQGAVGWWMVHSGLGRSDLTSVSQYRLAAHFITACFIIVAVFALARGLAVYTEKPAARSVRRFAAILVVLALVQIYFGALVAGLHAGRVYNSWPLMDGRLIPCNLLPLHPVWRNFFENIMTVQFVHRFFAYALLIIALIHAFMVQKECPASGYSRRAFILFGLILLQSLFGIVTLLLAVPIFWGLLHQIFALVVLSFAVAHWAAAKGALPPPVPKAV
ncbi:MAG: heme A synthase [Candidatus Tokpelaia sp.]|nr:MAG: heme A synthase [Candidatus Tokpelaia sp.]KAA6207721.1 MAG: heme A synthase [Candidatus Tokpelaia sp.]